MLSTRLCVLMLMLMPMRARPVNGPGHAVSPSCPRLVNSVSHAWPVCAAGRMPLTTRRDGVQGAGRERRLRLMVSPRGFLWHAVRADRVTLGDRSGSGGTGNSRALWWSCIQGVPKVIRRSSFNHTFLHVGVGNKLRISRTVTV